MEENNSSVVSPDAPGQEEQQAQLPRGNFLKDILEVILGILVAAVFLVVVFVGLNYFNIVSLSTLYPKQLGFLPHQGTTRSQQEPTKVLKKATPPPDIPLPVRKGFLPCPVKLSPCPPGKAVRAKPPKKPLIGLYYNVSPGTIIVANLAGEFTPGPVVSENLGYQNVFLIATHEKNLLIGYVFNGVPAPLFTSGSQQGSINEGDEIASLTDGRLFIFAKVLEDKKVGEFLRIRSEGNGIRFSPLEE